MGISPGCAITQAGRSQRTTWVVIGGMGLQVPASATMPNCTVAEPVPLGMHAAHEIELAPNVVRGSVNVFPCNAAGQPAGPNVTKSVSGTSHMPRGDP